MSPIISHVARIEGGIVGLLVGDALGVPSEFAPAQIVPPLADIEFDPPPGFERNQETVPPGTWSGDGAHALCLLDSLIRERCLVLRAGVPPEEAGPNGVHGSLMRVLPLALWHRGDDAHLVRDAQRQSLPTHGQLRARLRCALYCLWARRIIEDHAQPWKDAVATLRRLHADDPAALKEIEGPIGVDREPDPTGSGYVVDCLQSARYCLRQPTFEAVVKTAVSLGDDTDTTAAVAGGLAGVRYGIGAIPKRWRNGLRGGELLPPLLGRFITDM